MDVRPNLDQTVFQDVAEFEWSASPRPGVERVMLDRVGDEVAVATSIVRYAPGASFNSHTHALGEEFIVLDGEFMDEHGAYPAGSYVRNPPGTSHQPYSDSGCIIWVKLRQFDERDLTPVTAAIPKYEATAEPKVERLYTYEAEEVSWVHVPSGTRFAFPSHFNVREVLILAGRLTWQQEVTRTLGQWSWIRMSPGQPFRINALEDCVLFAKTRPVYRGRAHVSTLK